MPSLINTVLELCARQPEAVFARCWTRDAPPRDLTYHELLRRASGIAEGLRAAGVQDGDVVVVILRDEWTLIPAWLAPHLVGAVPALLPWPTPKLSPEHYARSVTLLLETCGARAVTTSAELLPGLRPLARGLDGQRFVLADEIGLADAALTPTAAVLEDPERIVVLQHSSGSTGLQKGVALSSRAVMNQLRAHGEAIGLNATDRYANWMPLYHDGGLVGGFLQPLVNGLPLSILSPMDWVHEPSLLLRAISTDRCTVCWLPNFAYNYMARAVPESRLEGVDLSCLRVLINTAEPVRPSSHEAFLRRFRAHGLDPLALTTSYGAAENTLAITQSPPGEPAPIDVVDRDLLSRDGIAAAPRPERSTETLLSSGRLLRNVELRVLDHRFRDLPERRVGEFAVRSDCMLSEYFNRPDLTQNAFHDGWYLTGDYGYVADGEVYVTGRKKDLIIVAGANIYPQDLEFVADEVEGVHPGRTAAFGVENEASGTEDVVIVVEVEEGHDPVVVARRVGHEIGRRTECFVRTVYPVPPMWLIKTSSGKISRRRCKERFLRETQEPDAAVRRRPARAPVQSATSGPGVEQGYRKAEGERGAWTANAAGERTAADEPRSRGGGSWPDRVVGALVLAEELCIQLAELLPFAA